MRRKYCAHQSPAPSPPRPVRREKTEERALVKGRGMRAEGKTSERKISALIPHPSSLPDPVGRSCQNGYTAR